MLYESPDMSRTQGFRIFAVKMKNGLQKSQLYFLVTPESVGQYAPEWVGHLTLDGSILKWQKQLAKVRLLILDDFGLAPLDQTQRLDLLEIIEDRHGRKSTVITAEKLNFNRLARITLLQYYSQWL